MRDRAKFLADLNALGKALRVEIDGPTRELYWREVGDVLTDMEWDAAHRRCVREERTLTVAGLLKQRNAERDLALRVEATRAYERVGRIARQGQAGAYWSESDVLKELGPEAARAFAACGGSNAFEHCDDRGEPFVRRAFVEWYVVASRSPAPPPDVKVLSAAPDRALEAKMRQTVWTSEEEAEMWEALVAANPKRHDENPLDYMGRIDELSGKVKRGEVMMDRPNPLADQRDARPPDDGVRLPYKDTDD